MGRGTAQFSKVGAKRMHKERAQPQHRKRFGLFSGLLEKKKDYVLRARNYHMKEDHLKLLRGKASMRNPDEFFFKMINSTTEDGVHISKIERDRTAETIKRMTSEDISYLASKCTSEMNKIQRMKSSLHMLDAEKQNTHTVFFDNEEQRTIFQKSKEKLQESAITEVPSSSKKPTEQLERLRAHQYKDLNSRLKRYAKLRDMVSQLQTRKNLMGKGRRKKIVTESDDLGDPVKTVYKWRKERKR
eukprot:591137_1